MKKILLLTMAIALALATPVWATYFGNNITVYDGVSEVPIVTNTWYGHQEDNEVEPYMATGQAWDLEGTFLDGKMLSVVGGFNFLNGKDGITIGDLFIDSSADAIYGPPADGSGYGPSNILNSFGWDWVVRLNMINLTYDVFQIDSNATVKSVKYQQNQESNPTQYVSGGNMIASGIGFNYLPGLTNAETGFIGGAHNAISGINLGFLGDNASFFGHITETCGNDNLMFSGKFNNPIPEPSTLLLLGFGLLGVASVVRKKTFNC